MNSNHSDKRKNKNADIFPAVNHVTTVLSLSTNDGVVKFPEGGLQVQSAVP